MGIGRITNSNPALLADTLLRHLLDQGPNCSRPVRTLPLCHAAMAMSMVLLRISVKKSGFTGLHKSHPHSTLRFRSSPLVLQS